ncbi:hypothetical protein K502DRAFT_298222, partial [Neoconidiobolus thromboides FSU 785]
MRFFETILTFSCISLILAQESGSGVDPIDYIFELKNETAFSEWETQVNQAVKEIQENGGNSRSSIVDKIFMVLSGLYVEAGDKLKCKACQVGVGALSLVTHVPFTKKPVVSAIGGLCQVATKQPKSVCEGIARSTGSEVYDVLNSIDRKNPYVRQIACVSLGDLCPFPDIPVTPLSLPAKK